MLSLAHSPPVGWGRELEGQKQEKNLRGQDKDSLMIEAGGRNK